MKQLSIFFLRTMIAIVLVTPGVSAQVSVIGELSQDKDVKPGDTYSGSILVRNDTNEPQQAKIYQTDYTFQFDGTNSYGEAGTLPRSNARWIAFSPSFLTLPPQATMAVNYTVTVPKDMGGKNLVGTYWSMMMVEGVQKGSAESSLPAKDKKAQMGIMQTIRYGIQIATTIANTGAKKIQFLGATIVNKQDGKPALQIDVENTGDIGMRPDMYVELFNEQGVSLGKFPGVKYRVYPGTSVRQLIDVSTVKKGTYKALVVVDAGGDDIFGAQYTVKF